MSETATIVPKRRSRLSLSLRGFMFVVLFIGCWLGWVTYKARQRRDAVAKLRQARVEVRYDWEFQNGKWVWSNGKVPAPGPRPQWPDRLINALGPDFFLRVVSVRVRTRNGDEDELMKYVAKLDQLEYLELAQSGVTDAGVSKLSRLVHLKRLLLHNTAITPKALVYLKNMVLLEDLSFESAGITDADLANLADLTRLKTLRLRDAKISDAGLAHLKNFTGLEFLELTNAKVTTIEPIRNSTGMTIFSLSGCPIDDIGLAAVARMHKLSSLNLAQTRVTDRGLSYLENLPKLSLVVLPSNIDPEKLKPLQAKHPSTDYMIPRASRSSANPAANPK